MWPICIYFCHVMLLDQQRIKNWVSSRRSHHKRTLVPTDTHKFWEQHSFRLSYSLPATSSKDCWLFTPFFLEMIELIREWNKCICVCVRAHFHQRRKEGTRNSPRLLVIVNCYYQYGCWTWLGSCRWMQSIWAIINKFYPGKLYKMQQLKNISIFSQQLAFDFTHISPINLEKINPTAQKSTVPDTNQYMNENDRPNSFQKKLVECRKSSKIVWQNKLEYPIERKAAFFIMPQDTRQQREVYIYKPTRVCVLHIISSLSPT